ncbi:MAG: hypothetical protein N4A38_00800 [Candidatus Gracilibacteria bacterium]|nr:hypothetical protein [Candidatus Gracilibacteria bacterium]
MNKATSLQDYTFIKEVELLQEEVEIIVEAINDFFQTHEIINPENKPTVKIQKEVLIDLDTETLDKLVKLLNDPIGYEIGCCPGFYRIFFKICYNYWIRNVDEPGSFSLDVLDFLIDNLKNMNSERSKKVLELVIDTSKRTREIVIFKKLPYC